MTIVRIGLVALGALLASACGSGTADSYTEYQDEMTDGIASVQTALTQHHEQVLAAPDLHQIGTLEQQHVHVMTGDMGRVGDANDSIAACNVAMPHMAGHMSGHMGRGISDGFEMMQSACQGMADVWLDASNELERHMHTMQAAPDLATARAEEQHYASTMDPLVQHMRLRNQDIAQTMQRLQDNGYSMMCAASN